MDQKVTIEDPQDTQAVLTHRVRHHHFGQGSLWQVGLNMMMLDMFKRRQEEDPAKYGCLMLDAMGIKQHIQYNSDTQKMSGFVVMVDGMNEALVFTVVGLQGHWKAPIAYYPTNCLSPGTQEVLLVHALEDLHECGIRVVCVTMDGHVSNVHMSNQLWVSAKGKSYWAFENILPTSCDWW